MYSTLNKRQHLTKENTMKKPVVNCFSSYPPYIFEVLVTACDKLVLSRCIEHMSLLHQPRDGSMFDIFVTSETMT